MGNKERADYLKQGGSYDPLSRQNAPTTAIDAEPGALVRISEDWVPYLLGLIDRLDQFDSFIGDDTQIEYARNEVRRLQEFIAEGMDLAYLKDLQLVGDTLQKTEDGSIWADVGRLVPIDDAAPSTTEVDASGVFQHANAATGNLLRVTKSGIPMLQVSDTAILSYAGNLSMIHDLATGTQSFSWSKRTTNANRPVILQMQNYWTNNVYETRVPTSVWKIAGWDGYESLYSFRYSPDGAELSYFDQWPPVGRQDVVGDVYGLGAFNLLQALHAFGLITNNATLQDVPPPYEPPPEDPLQSAPPNQYPDLPSPATSDMCLAANYIANVLYDQTIEVRDDLLSGTIEGVFNVLIRLGGWTFTLLGEWMAYLDTNKNATDLVSDLGAAIPTIAEYLYCNGLDLDGFVADVTADSNLPAIVKEIYTGLYEAAYPSNVALWAAQGVLFQGTADCSGYGCAGSWSKVYDFEANDDYTDGLDHQSDRLDYPGYPANPPVLQTNVGLDGVENLPNTGAQIINLVTEAGITVSRVKIHWTLQQTRFPSQHHAAIYLDGSLQQYFEANHTTLESNILDWNPPLPQNGIIGFNVLAACNFGSQDAVCRIRKIELEGPGPLPSIFT